VVMVVKKLVHMVAKKEAMVVKREVIHSLL